jgi:hypothetical protein
MPARLAQQEDENIQLQSSGSEKRMSSAAPLLGQGGAVRPWTDGGGWMLAGVCCRTTPSAKADTPPRRRRGTLPMPSIAAQQGFSEEEEMNRFPHKPKPDRGINAGGARKIKRVKHYF